MTDKTSNIKIESYAWDQLDGEGQRAYLAFCRYRDMSPQTRSHVAVCEVLDKDPGYVRQIAEWSTTHNWMERVKAWDAHQDNLRQQRNLQRQIEIEETAYDDYLFFREMIREAKEKYKAGKNKISDVRQLLGLIREADDHARRAVGLPDRITQNKNETDFRGSVTVAPGSLADEMAEVFKELNEWEEETDSGSPTG